jgi:hypothetical protein
MRIKGMKLTSVEPLDARGLSLVLSGPDAGRCELRCMTLTASIGVDYSRVSMSHGLLRTCRGTFVRCTFVTPTAMSSESARGSMKPLQPVGQVNAVARRLVSATAL